MLIALQKRKENIAEYILYLWQVEDLLRANELSIDRVKSMLVDPYALPVEQADELLQWYSNLIDTNVWVWRDYSTSREVNPLTGKV